MNSAIQEFRSVEEMLHSNAPHQPVYCIYPERYLASAKEFVANFPGRVLYAVKANDHPEVIRLLHDGGIRHFDCASLPEIEKVKQVCPAGKCYFMTSVRLRGAAQQAQTKHGVRHFVIDHLSGIAQLQREIDLPSSVIFARMAVHHPAAMMDLSTKFGAPPADIPELLTAIADAGAEPALAFNVGSNVSDPEAYRHSIGIAADVLAGLPFKLRLVDMGGGFPLNYPGLQVPPLDEYFKATREAAEALPLRDDGEIFLEPGRALAAPGMSAVVEVLLRKERRLFLNDGMYGVFWELRFEEYDNHPVRCLRDGIELGGKTQPYRLYGPTCDSSDALPGEVELPVDIRPGDYIEFASIGAYSLTGRTDFNGHHSEEIVTIRADAPGGAPL